MQLPFQLTWAQIGFHTSFGLLLLLFLRITRPSYLAFRRRRTGFGVVFDSVTGLPIDMATVSLRDVHGRIVRTVITEKDGHYRMMAPRGEYYFEITKQGYTFPSIYFKNKKQTTLYDNLLTTDHIVIKDHGALTKNIPIDHVDSKGQKSALTRNIELPKSAQYLISVLSPFVAGGLGLLMKGSWAIWAMFACYLIALMNRLFSFSPPKPPFGTIRDATTGEPLPGVIVRIMNSTNNKLLETQITSIKGRYAFIVKKGAYRILISKQGYKSVMLNFPAVKEDSFLLTKDVRMSKVVNAPT